VRLRLLRIIKNPIKDKVDEVLADTINNVYVFTVTFKYSASNANQTFLRLQLEGGNGAPYERVGQDISVGKGNDVEHEFHSVFQYYVDSGFCY
jgi:hypothetical protein